MVSVVVMVVVVAVVVVAPVVFVVVVVVVVVVVAVVVAVVVVVVVVAVAPVVVVLVAIVALALVLDVGALSPLMRGLLASSAHCLRTCFRSLTRPGASRLGLLLRCLGERLEQPLRLKPRALEEVRRCRYLCPHALRRG